MMSSSEKFTPPSGLEEIEDGIFGPRESAAISYPAEGNRFCFEVEEGSFWFRHRNRCLVDVMKLWSPGGPLLDVGGGNGCVALALKESGFDAVVLEPGIEGARNARSRGLRPVICARLEDAGFTPGSVAAVGFFDVLEHIAEDREFLKRIFTLLAPGGRVYCTVPAYAALWSLEDREAGHFRRYHAGGLKTLLKSEGFDIEYLTYFFSFLPLPILLARALPYRLGLAKRHDIKDESRQHLAGGLSARFLDLCSQMELAVIRRGGRIPMGSSILAVVKKMQ